MKVNNVNGTSGLACKCGSWFNHWRNYSGQAFSYCLAVKCFEKPEVGAHVQKEDASDRDWYIIPLCQKHNAETGKSLEVYDGLVLVSADARKTCG